MYQKRPLAHLGSHLLPVIPPGQPELVLPGSPCQYDFHDSGGSRKLTTFADTESSSYSLPSSRKRYPKVLPDRMHSSPSLRSPLPQSAPAFPPRLCSTSLDNKSFSRSGGKRLYNLPDSQVSRCCNIFLYRSRTSCSVLST